MLFVVAHAFGEYPVAKIQQLRVNWIHLTKTQVAGIPWAFQAQVKTRQLEKHERKMLHPALARHLEESPDAWRKTAQKPKVPT